MTRVQALAGALERRGLPGDIGAAYRSGTGRTHQDRHRLHVRIREAHLEAHRLMSQADPMHDDEAR